MRRKRCLQCGHIHMCKNRKSSAKRQRPEPKAFWRNGHEYLETPREMTLRRMEIYRNAGGEVRWFDEADPDSIEDLKPAMCQGCAEPHPLSWAGLGAPRGEYHHNVKSKGGRRCDCAACGLYLCPAIHEAYRNKVIPVIQRGAS